MKTTGNNPRVRKNAIVEQQSQKELLIYDLRNNCAYCLNETSELIYRLCDGTNSIEEITDRVGRNLRQPVTREFVLLALDQFKRDELLIDTDRSDLYFNGFKRRDVIKKVGLASLIALPLVSSVVAPSSVNAQSCFTLGQPCAANNGNQGNCCDSSNRCTNTGTGPACNACLGSGVNTNCSTGPGCCTAQFAFFSNSCCNGVDESPTVAPGVLRCSCR